MDLESVSIERFRSISNSELADCGGFNVLIGKNNSGKSNILSAISAFFACLANGDVVSLDPPVGQEFDFYNKDISQPIKITLVFALTLAERDALIQDIVAEAPQMKNAVDGIDPSLQLLLTVSIVPPPTRFGFVSKITLSPKVGGAQRTILSVSTEAARELYQRLSAAQRYQQDVKALQRMRDNLDSDDWRLISGSSREGPAPLTILRRLLPYEAGSAVAELVELAAREAASFEDFRTALRTEAKKMTEEADAVQGRALDNKLGTFAGEEPYVPNYVRNLLRSISEIRVHQLSEQRKPIGKEEAERLLALKVRRGGTEILRNIQETVSALLGVQIDAFEGSPARRGETSAEMDVDNFLVQVNGSGIREALRLVLDVEFEHPQVLLVEEPEVHLHPALETSMMRLLQTISSRCQVFVTTHSTNFLDTAEMRNVYLVSRNGSTRIQLVNLEEAEVQIPRELGVRLSSLFMFDRLVFVEGPSDEAIIREWATKMDVNLSQKTVGFVPMGGVRHLSYFATEATLTFLTKRQVKMWFVIDRDEKDNEEVARIKEKLGQNASIHVLKKREIENYLIAPRPLRELIYITPGAS